MSIKRTSRKPIITLFTGPPVSVSFQCEEDRQEVLSKAAGLLDRQSNIQITPDMSRATRVQWGELNKFMVKVKERYPASQCQLSPDRLMVDGRAFVVDRLSGKVEEQVVVTIPITGEATTSAAAQLRAPSKVQVDEVEVKLNPYS